MNPTRRRRTVAVTAAAPLAGLFSAPTGQAAEQPCRIVENLDRVLVAAAAGTTFADGTQVTAPSPANQFVSVIDGATGTERTRQPAPDDFVADGPSSGCFGMACPDGEHPAWSPSRLTRVGARRGAFRTLFQTWDFNGTDLTRRVPRPSLTTPAH